MKCVSEPPGRGFVAWWACKCESSRMFRRFGLSASLNFRLIACATPPATAIAPEILALGVLDRKWGKGIPTLIISILLVILLAAGRLFLRLHCCAERIDHCCSQFLP